MFLPSNPSLPPFPLLEICKTHYARQICLETPFFDVKVEKMCMEGVLYQCDTGTRYRGTDSDRLTDSGGSKV